MPLDIQFVVQNPGVVRDSQLKRDPEGTSVELIDTVLDLHEQWKSGRIAVEELQTRANRISKSFGRVRAEGGDIDALRTEVKNLKERIKVLDAQSLELLQQRDRTLNLIGNLIHDDVPVAAKEDHNTVVREFNTEGIEVGTRQGLTHVDLLHMMDAVEYDRGQKVAGSRGFFLKGVGVQLNQALIQYGLNFLAQREYTRMQTPFFMLQDVMAETAQLDDFHEQLYKVTETEDPEEAPKYLIATSEQPISALHRDEVMLPKDLPIKYAGVSTCFRKEAGSHGRDQLGIFRVHQFEKIEQFCITEPDDSWEMFHNMIGTAEEFYQSLGIPYQIVAIASGALNNAAAMKLDLEAYFPGQGAYRELVSCSNCLDYQSRALRVKCGVKAAKEKYATYVHMLNATLCATERALCCLVENCQDETGIVIPEVLRPYILDIHGQPMERIDFVQGPYPIPETKPKRGKKKGRGHQ